MSTLDNNSLILVRGAWSGTQSYRDIMKSIQSVCRGASFAQSYEAGIIREQTDCVAVECKTVLILTVCEVSRLDNNSLLQLGGANTPESLLSQEYCSQ